MYSVFRKCPISLAYIMASAVLLMVTSQSQWWWFSNNTFYSIISI